MISPNIKPYASEPGAYGIACSEIGTLPATLDLTFTTITGEPFNLTIPSSELNVGPFSDDPSTCQTLINAFDGLELVGGSLLKHYYSVWDLSNQRMGFAWNGAWYTFLMLNVVLRGIVQACHNGFDVIHYKYLCADASERDILRLCFGYVFDLCENTPHQIQTFFPVIHSSVSQSFVVSLASSIQTKNVTVGLLHSQRVAKTCPA